MSRQLTIGVLGRKKNLAVQLANEYIARVTSEPYSLIGAGILNWDIDGNPPANLFDGAGNINPANYDTVIARNTIIDEYQRLINENEFDKLEISVSKDFGIRFSNTTYNTVVKLFDLSNNNYDCENTGDGQIIRNDGIYSNGTNDFRNDMSIREQTKILSRYKFRATDGGANFQFIFRCGATSNANRGMQLAFHSTIRLYLYVSDGSNRPITVIHSGDMAYGIEYDCTFSWDGRNTSKEYVHDANNLNQGGTTSTSFDSNDSPLILGFGNGMVFLNYSLYYV